MQAGRGEEGGVNFANCWLTGSDIDPGVDYRRRRRRLQEPRRPRGCFSDAAFDIFWSKKYNLGVFYQEKRSYFLSNEEDRVEGRVLYTQ